MQRAEIAYLLIALIVAALAATFVYLRYYSRQRIYLRRQKREREEHAQRMQRKEQGHDER